MMADGIFQDSINTMGDYPGAGRHHQGGYPHQQPVYGAPTYGGAPQYGQPQGGYGFVGFGFDGGAG